MNRAKQRNIEFTLSLKRLSQLRRTKYCYYTGILLTHDKANQLPTSWSIDRVDNTKGYTDENTVVSCFEINQKKNNLTPEQILNIYQGLKRKRVL